jgi:dCMP deaminase
MIQPYQHLEMSQKSKRQTWNEYFITLAKQVSTRATCPRKQVGCVIVKDRTIVATGYNGSLPGQPHCDTHNCFLNNGHCVRTIHAETNAINQAAKNGVAIKGATIYCNVEPCWSCYKNITASGIVAIYYCEPYGSKMALHAQCIASNLVKYNLIEN